MAHFDLENMKLKVKIKESKVPELLAVAEGIFVKRQQSSWNEKYKIVNINHIQPFTKTDTIFKTSKIKYESQL